MPSTLRFHNGPAIAQILSIFSVLLAGARPIVASKRTLGACAVIPKNCIVKIGEEGLMNEAGYDLVAHKHYRERVINIMRVRSERFVKRDRRLRGVFIRGQLVRSLVHFSFYHAR